MKKTVLFLAFLLFISSIILARVSAAETFDLSESYSPTRAEWLELSLLAAASGINRQYYPDLTVAYTCKDDHLLMTLRRPEDIDEDDPDFVNFEWVSNFLAKNITERYAWSKGIPIKVEIVIEEEEEENP